ncbi:MAG: SDR family oxidoreductase [Cytophagales bacterium]|nr:SDR family oxidoreductase [Cytophagales bacterium]
MDLKLEGKTAFITGSTKGIGFAIARQLLAEKVHVILNGRSASAIVEAKTQLQTEFPKSQISGFPCDFANSEDIQQLLENLPPVDLLINNVGIYYPGSFTEASDGDWTRQFEVNVMSGVRLSRYLLPKMQDKNWGRIVFISSECASLVPEDLIPYSTTKAALHAISRGLAQMTKGTGVTVNTVVPGSTLSEGAQNFLSEVAQKENKTPEQVEKEFFTNVRTSSLLQRFASVEEVASAVAYLCSPLAAATNGSVLKADGGSTGGVM